MILFLANLTRGEIMRRAEDDPIRKGGGLSPEREDPFSPVLVLNQPNKAYSHGNGDMQKRNLFFLIHLTNIPPIWVLKLIKT